MLTSSFGSSVNSSRESTSIILNQLVHGNLFSWIPTTFFILTLPFLLLQCRLSSKNYIPLPYSNKFILKLILTGLLASNSSFIWLTISFSSDNFSSIYFIYPAAWVLFFSISFLIHLIRRESGVVTSGAQHINALLYFICEPPLFYQRFFGTDQEFLVLKIAHYIWFALLFVYLIALFYADSRLQKLQKGESPELRSSFLNHLTLWWFNSIPWIGARRDLELKDIFDLNEVSGSQYLMNEWERKWEPKRTKYNQLKKTSAKEIPLPSIAYNFFQVFKWDFSLSVSLKFVDDTIQFASPFLLNEMLNYISTPNAPFWEGVAIAVLMFTVSQVRSFLSCSYIYTLLGTSLKIQTTLTTAIYQKVLVLSSKERRERSSGEIVNLTAVDVEKIKNFTPFIPLFWSCPYLITFTLVYLFFTIGYSAIPGVIVMLLFFPINIVSAMIVKKWQTEQMKLKDERTKLVNEVINGIKVEKMYAWESPMEKRIAKIRDEELQLTKKISMVKNILDSFNVASPFFVALFSFGTFVLSSSENLLTPQIAFVSLTLFNQLRLPMTMMAGLIDTTVQVSGSRSQTAIKLENFTASWDETDEASVTLKNINITIPHGFLTVVCGNRRTN